MARRGRPPTPETAKPVKANVKLPPAVYDAYCREALRLGVPVHALLRRALVRGISGGQKNRRRRPRVQAGPGSPQTGRV